MLRALVLLISFAGLAGSAAAQDEPARLTSRSLAPAVPQGSRGMPSAPSVHRLSIGRLSGPGSDMTTLPGDSAEASVEDLAERAKNGEADANYRLALRYLAGDGIKRDFIEAFARIRLAAEAGHPRAISLFYMIGAKLTAEEHAEAFERSQKLRTEMRAAR